MSDSPQDGSAEHQQTVEQVTGNIARAANVENAFGPTRTEGAHSVIPVAEVVCGMGFAVASGNGQANAGGSGTGSGGFAATRPLAAIVVGPEGVTIKPVYDMTKLWLAALTTLAFVLPWLGRLRGGRPSCCGDNPGREFRRFRRALR